MIIGVVQARVSSSRLPGKVLKPILGSPLMARQLERIRRVKQIDEVIVATSTEESDEPIAKLCLELGLCCFRGSLNDVLDRFYQAVRERAPEQVVRLTADCPLTDPALIESLIRFHLQGGFDYSSNALEPTFPDGMDAEIFRFSSLAAAWQEAELPSEREHVTAFIYKRPQRFRIGSYKGPVDLSSLRLTVDEAKDFALVSRLYEALYPLCPEFGLPEILAFLEANPELKLFNAQIKRNAGYEKSLRKDEEFKSKQEREKNQ